MDECIDSIFEAHYFIILNANSGYWQMNIRKQDRHKSTFLCHAGTVQYLRMKFGLSSAPEIFQRALYNILTKYIWKKFLTYVDDVIIYSKNLCEHIHHVEKILSTLGTARVTLNVKKCHLFQRKVEYR